MIHATNPEMAGELGSTVTTPAYPSRWEADVVVADGATVHLRPITPADADAVVTFHAGLSEKTRYLRYFSPYPSISKRDLARFTEMDNVNQVALAAWLGHDIIAIGRFHRLAEGSSRAEVAFVVADQHQGRGIGSMLLEHLAEAAREVGVLELEALVLAENHTMARVFLDAGYDSRRQWSGSEVLLTLDITSTQHTEQVMAAREQLSESRSIQRLLFPRSIAVVGASADDRKIGRLVFDNIRTGGFTGPVYAVNVSQRPIAGVPSYRTVLDIEGPVDLAVIAVPAAEVLDVITACGLAGVLGVVIVSSGFGESGEDDDRLQGLQSQRQLVATARVHGMRVLGPNCLGLINTDPAMSLNSSLSTVAPLRGRVGFFCQSGALGAAILGEGNRRGLGLSTFVSAGNRADVSGNDLLQFWEGDPATDVALLYLESFGNPRKFARIARRFARRKPIVAVKSGRGLLVDGLRPTAIDLPDDTVRALFEASGVIRTETIGDLFDVAVLLATQPLPPGNRVAVVGQSTAIAMLVRNALSAAGLPLARVVDVGVDSSPEEFGSALAEVLADDDVDSVVTIFVPPMRRGSERAVAEMIRRTALGDQSAEQNKPVLSVFLGFDGVPEALSVRGLEHPMRGSIPSYSSPERAVAALSHVSRYAQWRRRTQDWMPTLSGVDRNSAAALILKVLTDRPEGRYLSYAESTELLACYGISCVPSPTANGVLDACRIAEEVGYPVAVKVDGAVRLHLADAAAIVTAWESLGLGPVDQGVVQPMAPRGTDTVMRIHQDQSFGSLISFGIGGVATDLLSDRAYAVVPLTAQDADELITGPKASPLLTGYRGSEPVDLEALRDLAMRLALLADHHPEVIDCLLDPVIAEPTGVHVLNATMRLAPAMFTAQLGPRRIDAV